MQTVKKTCSLSKYSFCRMWHEVVIFGAEYFKQCHNHVLETLSFELVLKRAFIECILLPPPPLPFVVSELQFVEVKFKCKQ